MNVQNNKNQQASNLPPDAIPNAMNLVGQNLLKTLVQTMQNLPPELRSNEMAMHGMAAFLSNVIYKQTPQNQEIREKMLDRIQKLVLVHLANIAEDAPKTSQ